MGDCLPGKCHLDKEQSYREDQKHARMLHVAFPAPSLELSPCVFSGCVPMEALGKLVDSPAGWPHACTQACQLLSVPLESSLWHLRTLPGNFEISGIVICLCPHYWKAN